MLMVCHHLDQHDPRGRRVRREPHPRRDDRRRGHAARSRARSASSRATARRWAASASRSRAPGRRRTRCAEQRGRLAGETRRQRQPAHPPLHRQVHDQPGDRARHVARDRLASRSASWPTSCSGGRRSSASRPELVIKGGFIAWAQMGDANASIPTPQPLVHAADVRRARRRDGRDLASRSSRSARARGGHVAELGLDEAARRRQRLPRHRQARHEAERRAAGDHRRSRSATRCAPTACSCDRRRRRSLPLAQRYSLF